MAQLQASLSAAAEAAPIANQRHNFAVNVADVSLYMLGASMISAVVVVPKLMLGLGSPLWLVALLPALQILGGRLPSVATSFLVEGRPRLKGFILCIGVMQRLPWLLIGVLLLVAGATHPTLALVGVVVCFALAHTAFGLGSPAYGEFIARAIAARRRGVFMGAITFLGHGMGVAGGLVVLLLMGSQSLRFPYNFAALFFIASLVLWVSYLFFAMNRETPHHVSRDHHQWSHYLGSLPGVLRHDRPFGWFLVYQSLFYAFVMGNGLFMAYAVQRFDLADEATGGFVMATTIATMAAAPVLGLIGDRHGHHVVLALGCAAYIAAALLAAIAPGPGAMYAVFAPAAVCLAAQLISTRNYTYLFGGVDRRPTYLALASTVPAPFVLLFSLVGGWVAEHVAGGFTIVFLVSAGIVAAAMGVLLTKAKAQAPWPDRCTPAEPATAATAPLSTPAAAGAAAARQGTT